MQTDAEYIDEGISVRCKPFVRSLLHVPIAERLGASEGSRQAAVLLSCCALEEVLGETRAGYFPGILLKIDDALQSATGLDSDMAEARKPLEKQMRAYQSAIAAEMYAAVDSTEIRVVCKLLKQYEVDKQFVLEAYVALRQHEERLIYAMQTRLLKAAEQGNEHVIQAAVAAARDYGESVDETRKIARAALAKLQTHGISQAALTFAYCGGNQCGQGTSTCFQQGQPSSTHAPAVCGEALDPTSGPVFWKATVLEHDNSDLILGVIGNPKPADRSWTDPTVFSWGAHA
eukprot:COSAG02_NODE_8884_length_2410_cov_1.013847_1_plen_288_part_00